MSFTDEYLRVLFPPECFAWFSALQAQNDQLDAHRAEVMKRYLISSPVTGSTYELRDAKCSECGLTGNHEIWCGHWTAYVAEEP